MKKLLSLILFLLLIASPVWATTYYVDTGSTGTGDGTTTALTGANAAFKTLTEVNSKNFAAGDYCLFNRGQTWNEKLIYSSSGSVGSLVSYDAYGTGADPVFDESVQKTDWTLLTGTTWTRTNTGEVGQTVGQVFQDGVRLKKATSLANCEATAGSWWGSAGDHVNVNLTDGSNPNTAHVVEHPIFNNAVDTNGKAWVSISHITGKRTTNGVFNFREVAGAHDLVVQYCRASQGMNRGFDGNGNVEKYNITIDHCIADDNLGEGIWMGGSGAGGGAGFVITNNEIFDGNKAVLTSGYTTPGIAGINLSYDVTGAIVTGNYVHDCYSNAMFCFEWQSGHANITGATVTFNRFIANQPCTTYGGGIWFAGGDSTCVFAHNLVWLTSASCGGVKGHAISIDSASGGGCAGVKIYNNTIIQECTVMWAVLSHTNRYADIENNIIRNTASNSTIDLPASTPANTLKNNLYYGLDGTHFYAMWAGSEYTTLSTWAAASGETNGQIADPLFVSTTDFHLQATSPAINAGIDVGFPYCGTSLDIGAYEFCIPVILAPSEHGGFGGGFRNP